MGGDTQLCACAFSQLPNSTIFYRTPFVGPPLSHALSGVRSFPRMRTYSQAFTAIRTTSGELRIVELDGTKPAAVDHGRVPDDNLVNFLAATAKVIQTNFFDVDPEIVEFNMMALCKPL